MQTTVVLVAIGLLAAGGIHVAGRLVDKGLDAYVARRLPAIIGGLAFLMATSMLAPVKAIVFSWLTVLVLLFARLWKPGLFRGVEGSLPSQPWLDVTFAASGAACLSIGWGLLDDRWLAFVPIGFMAWGDSASGLLSDHLRRTGRRVFIGPPGAMLAICLLVALFYSPFWIAAIGGVVATVVERVSPTVLGVQDDNWLITGASLGVMAAISYS